MEKGKNQVKSRFFTILLCILTVLLCAAPRSWAGDYNGGVHDIISDEDHLNIGTTASGTIVNLYAFITNDVIVGPDSFLNIYRGNVGGNVIVNPSAVVTVYGTNFAVDSVLLDPSATYFTVQSSNAKTLTGYYGNQSEINLLFTNYSNSDITIYLTPPISTVKQVKIDIKPGSNPNSINLKSKGVVPAAVLTDGDFNADSVDPTTVEFAGIEPVRWTLCDVDDDGDLDMLFHFKTQELELDENSTEATLMGKTLNGDDIEGTDEVRIVPQKKTKKK